jgi:hypothetical protein
MGELGCNAVISVRVFSSVDSHGTRFKARPNCSSPRKRLVVPVLYRVGVLYSAFADKVEHNCHFPASGRNCYYIGQLIKLFSLIDT